MTVDYDTPRRARAEDEGQPLEDLAGRLSESSEGPRDLDDVDAVDSYDLPDADLTGEELMVQVLPKQPDEFACSSCFLVHHRSRLARVCDGAHVCTDCA